MVIALQQDGSLRKLTRSRIRNILISTLDGKVYRNSKKAEYSLKGSSSSDQAHARGEDEAASDREHQIAFLPEVPS
jgi:hypothetical protein